MHTGRLTAGGPHYYALRPDSMIGGEVYERELLSRLPAHGVDVRVGLPRAHAVAQPPDGWQIDVLRHRPHWTLLPAVYGPYAMRLIRSGVDVLRGHSVRYTGPSLLLAKSLTRSRVPLVLHHHHLFPRWAKLELRIAAKADAVITVSEHSRRELIEGGVPAERIHVIVEGVERPPASEGMRDAWGPGLRLLQLGRLEERKRPWVAIDALRAFDGEASLVVAGEGPMRDELERRADGLDVRFLGHVLEEDKWRLYDSADVLLFASTLEGFGLVVAEAQSRGVPVIAAAGTATAEALDPGRSGLLTAPDGEAFAAALGELADDERRRAMSAHAREFARRFDWEACAATVAALYREVAAR